MPTLRERYSEVMGRIADASARSGRARDAVYCVAVTKYAAIEDIETLYDLGHRDFGERRAPQLAQRASMIDEWLTRRRAAGDAPQDDTPPRWHMIGHLQRNKARKLAGVVRLVHSVDSMRLAEELQQVADRFSSTIDVLVQVNISGEDAKYGLPIAAVGAIAEQIDTMINVRVRGLMTMAPFVEDAEAARPHFARCRELFEEIRVSGAGEGHFNLLSMGMTNDYEVAIEEGANLVRVGSALFGDEDPEGESDAEGEPAHASSGDADDRD